MSIGEIIATLALYLGNSMQAVITSDVGRIEVQDNYVEVYFKGKNSGVRIDHTGKMEFLD